jgi:spore coat protein U domain-containing protein, fimbrial subunit CupE1/2/3/6
MKRLLALAALAAAAVLLPITAWAQTATANLDVTANVQGVCTIAPATLNFANYEPSDAVADSATGTITVTCTQGSVFWIGLANGLDFAGGFRQMANGADRLRYELFRDAGFGVPWDNADPLVGPYTITAASAAPIDSTVYGRIPAAQNVPTGVYSDTVVMTVNF